MIKISDFSKNNNISEKKAKLMAPYILGAKQCPYCKRWELPNNAKPIYIADKRKYGKLKKYCYVMDAIAFGWQIDERLSGVSENECKTIVPQLKNNGLIILKHGCKNDSIDYRDYMLPLALESDWKQQTSNNRTQNVINALKIINEIIKFGGTIATIANMVI